MSGIRFGRGREYQFFRREDVCSRWDLAAAVDVLNGLRGNTAAISLFRPEVGTLGQATAGLTDAQMNQSITPVVVAGKSLVPPPQREAKKGTLNPRKPVPAHHSTALQAAQ